ncbi:MAG TPA: NDP-sugar synthase [Actinomycetota bacterium]|nr:NDP-sugar synthase [Actinomycetota bacterium]
MKAVVLVGGEGTRLRPLTETVPKPLLPFMNRPFLDHVLDHLARHGVDEVICSSPYLEERFHGFLESRSSARPAVTWITEAEPLGTAGAIAGAREHVDGTFLALNGDVLTDIDVTGLIAAHREHEATATIALTAVDDARPFGLVETEEDGRVTAFREKPEVRIPGRVNAGIYVLEPRALDRVSPGVMVSIERETYPDLIRRGEPVLGQLADGYWRDLGNPAAYLQGHVDALDGRIEAYRGTTGPLVAAGAGVDPSARIEEHVVVAPGAEVGRNATVARSVLHADVSVGAEAVVDGSILGARSRVESGAEVREAVLAEGARVPEGVRLVRTTLGPGEVASDPGRAASVR